MSTLLLTSVSAEARPQPAPAPSLSPAEELLNEWSADEELLRAGRPAAENPREGMAARESDS